MLPNSTITPARKPQARTKYVYTPTVFSDFTVDTATRQITGVICTPQADRAGDIVLPLGCMNREAYLQNPVVLWAHQRMIPPIGKCVQLQIEADRIVATTQFSESSAFARDLFQLYAEGILRGWSIGFLPRKVRPRPFRQRGEQIEQWELLEYSAVPIPENPAAITPWVQKGVMESAELQDWLMFHCSCNAPTPDVLQHLFSQA